MSRAERGEAEFEQSVMAQDSYTIKINYDALRNQLIRVV
jgi:hypothetical protein